MMRTRRHPATAPRIGLGLILLALATPATAQDTPSGLRYTGTGSCAALACHGGRREPRGLVGSEYNFSATYDPHRKAYNALYDDRSKQIERNYRRLEASAEATPERDTLCLSCHVHPNFKPEAVEREAAFVSDGVGCEGCHGPAERYLAAHMQGWWRGLSPEVKAGQFGLANTKNLATRVKLCAECHLGSTSAEVNHDLYAAGHPRLLYEFANQQAKHPKHWPAGADKGRDFDYEVRAWALGQAVSTKASLDLLAARVERADAPNEPGPWPEFAEYDCYSCHHGLQAPSSRQAGYRPQGRTPGTLAWGNWNLPAIRALGELRGVSVDRPGGKSAMVQLEELMAKTEPEPAEVARLVRLASDELVPLIDRLGTERFRRDDVEKLLTAFSSPKESDWTDAARGYLATVALSRARGDLGGPPVDFPLIEKLRTVQASLAVPIVRPDGRIVDSPVGFPPNQVRNESGTPNR